MSIAGEQTAFVVLAVALLAPLLAQTPVAARLPVVVLEVLLGMVAGPHALGWIEATPFLKQMMAIGTTAVLFMAGMEVDFELIRGRPLRLACAWWLLALAIALAGVAVLHVVPDVDAPIMVALALVTTGLGLLPRTLRESGKLTTVYGRLLLAAGTVGQVAPAVAVALTLSPRYNAAHEFAFLVAFLALVVVAVLVGVSVRPPPMVALLTRTLHASTQLPVRLTLVFVGGFLVLSDKLGLEGILGALAAGMVVGRASRDAEAEPFRIKLDAISFGFLTPFFFVGTGASFDLTTMTRDLPTILLVPTFLLLFLAAHGLPIALYRQQLVLHERLSFSLSTSVASLALVAVIVEVGRHRHGMNVDTGQALLAATLLSMLVFPSLAALLATRRGSGR